jgi:hypothetical protein
MRVNGTPIERLLAHIKVEAAGYLTPCWLWTAYVAPHGYGTFRLGGRMMLAHRAAYELLRRPLTESFEVDHLCRNRTCVNPEHLEEVVRDTNWRRSDAVTRKYSDQTHCKRGHAFDEANTYRYGTGRICRACRRMYARQRYLEATS